MTSTSKEHLINAKAFTLYEAIKLLEWNADPQTLIKRVQRLELGLPLEDEFCLLLSWLGRCRLVHKLDQLQSPPKSKELYRIPDLLAIFEYENQQVPILIEVKGSRSTTLSWKPDYFYSLQRYANELKLPLLIACKWKRPNLWSLFEARHFCREDGKYKIHLEKAFQENLMSLLVGDFAIVFKTGIGFHVIARKEKKLEEKKEGENVSKQTWLLRIEDAYFTDCQNKKFTRLGPGFWSLFLLSPLEAEDEVGDTHIRQSFIVKSEKTMQWLHRALPILLEFKKKEQEKLNWHEILRDYSVPIEISLLTQVANEALSRGIVQNIFHMKPRTKPQLVCN